MDENEFDREDPLSLNRSTVTETVMISETPNLIIDDEHVVLVLGEGKTTISLIDDSHRSVSLHFQINFNREILLQCHKGYQIVSY